MLRDFVIYLFVLFGLPYETPVPHKLNNIEFRKIKRDGLYCTACIFGLKWCLSQKFHIPPLSLLAPWFFLLCIFYLCRSPNFKLCYWSIITKHQIHTLAETIEDSAIDSEIQRPELGQRCWIHIYWRRRISFNKWRRELHIHK